jgi:hypothetical protein
LIELVGVVGLVAESVSERGGQGCGAGVGSKVWCCVPSFGDEFGVAGARDVQQELAGYFIPVLACQCL